jgi:haloalkane dehalogenase
MAFLEADALAPLPAFIEREWPLAQRQGRRMYEVERGAHVRRRIHLIDVGPRDARPVLMLHGNPTWSFLWRKVIAALPAGRYRCIAPDLFGLGLSSRIRADEFSVDDQADALAELVEALDLRGVILALQDWGGPFGAATAARVPERIAAAMIANTSVLTPRRFKSTAFHRFANLPGVSDAVFKALNFPTGMLWIAQGDRASIRGAVQRAYVWPLRRWSERIAPLALARLVPTREGHPSLPALARGEAFMCGQDAAGWQGPVHLVWGTKDPVLGGLLRRHEEAFPRAAVTRTAAGHFLQEEVPDAIAAAIVDLDEQLRAPA